MPGARLLIIDDEEPILYTLNALFKKEGYEVMTCSSGEEGLRIFEESPDSFDLVLTDLSLGGRVDGMKILERVKAISPETFVIMITAYGSERIAVEAMTRGAYYYLKKPFKNDEIRLLVRQAMERLKLERENVALKAELAEKYSFANIVGVSEKIKHVFELISKVAAVDVTVLITGESGTGKELVARAIHYASNRRAKPFIPLNCAAIPESILENELFGHTKGSYTGAHTDRKGKFEMANGGTLFLDEIGDMPLVTQAKVLRAIQEQVIQRIGGNEDIKVDVRIVAATNKNLENEIAEKRFREDLFYRLNVVRIALPPLRERPEDIPVLVSHFIEKFNQKLGRKFKGVEEAAMRILEKHSWPGNVRELQNVIEKAMVLSTSDIIRCADLAGLGEYSRLACLAEKEQQAPTSSIFEEALGLPYRDAERAVLGEFEKKYFEAILEKANRSLLKASELSGLEPDLLKRKLVTNGMDFINDCLHVNGETAPKNAVQERESSLSGAGITFDSILMMPFHEAEGLILDIFERFYLTHFLEKNNGNILQTSAEICLSRGSLSSKIKELGIDVDSLSSGKASKKAAVEMSILPGIDTEKLINMPFHEAEDAVTRKFETLYLDHALKLSKGNIQRTAQRIGLHRRSIEKKMKELSMDPAFYRQEK